MGRDSTESAVLRTIEEVGGEVVKVTRKRHVKIRWRLRGRTMAEVVSATSSDHRATLNAVANVRRRTNKVAPG